jgi:hypothetical protein
VILAWARGVDQKLDPCFSCGECCAFFRVQFYWREANREDVNPCVPLAYCDLQSRKPEVDQRGIERPPEFSRHERLKRPESAPTGSLRVGEDKSRQSNANPNEIYHPRHGRRERPSRRADCAHPPNGLAAVSVRQQCASRVRCAGSRGVAVGGHGHNLLSRDVPLGPVLHLGVGLMLAFRWKALSGSQRRLTSARRAYFSGP